MILLTFRQNLCGSTYFHRLNDIDQNGGNPSPPVTLPGGWESLTDGVVLDMNQHEFSLYYNYSASKLESAFQAVSTLTKKGEEYCRQTGTGIAMIEFTLMKGNGDYVNEVNFAYPATESTSKVDFPLKDLRMENLSSFPIER